uniref:Retrotransposon gag domain-containing protein n=1 Tax=Oryza sativa subsp. japonica TaxID=39947 RepID=Q53M66_ORYSJ|nr:hypothetical protein LOC_Os11g20400 [Oryza sativa Japonica Group]
MPYYVDPRSNGPQVYGYPPLTVARQVGRLGAQGSTTMTSSLFDDSVDPGINQGASTSTMLVWTQVGEIVFPVYTTMPISNGPAITRSENGVVTTPVDSTSKDPPAEAENGTSTTFEPEKDPNTAKSCLPDEKHEPTRITSEATRTCTSTGGNTEAEDQLATQAQHIRTINAILRETPYDPVLNADLDQWMKRLRESVANLSNAFEEAAARAPPEQPPTGGANGEQPEQRTPPRQATPLPRGTSDLRDHLNGRREARRTQDNENRSRHRVSSRHRENEEQGRHPSENRDRDDRHNRRERTNREQQMPGDTSRGRRRNDDDDGDQRRDNNDLWQQFVANFQGTYKRHAIEDDLHALKQNPGESLRDYIRRFNECRNTIPEITDASVIRAFKSDVRDRYTTQELATRWITTARKLFEIVDQCTHADDALRRKNDKPKTGGEKKPAKDAPEASKRKSRRSRKRKAQTEVLTAEYADPPKHLDPQGDDTKQIWCPIHESDKHSLETCFVFKKALTKQLALENSDLVEKLELPTQPHPHPYYIKWFNSCGKFKASENKQGNGKEKKDEEEKDLSLAPCMLEECLINQAPIISEDEKKEDRMHISNSLSSSSSCLNELQVGLQEGECCGFSTTKILGSNHMAIKKCSAQDVVIDKDKCNTLHDKVKPRMVSNQEGEDDEDTTSLDITMATLCINQPKRYLLG